MSIKWHFCLKFGSEDERQPIWPSHKDGVMITAQLLCQHFHRQPLCPSVKAAFWRSSGEKKKHKEKKPLLCGGVVQRPSWGVTIVYCHCFLFRPIKTRLLVRRANCSSIIFPLLKEITWCWSLPDESLIFLGFTNKSNHRDTFYYKGILLPVPLSWTRSKGCYQCGGVRWAGNRETTLLLRGDNCVPVLVTAQCTCADTHSVRSLYSC